MIKPDLDRSSTEERPFLDFDSDRMLSTAQQDLPSSVDECGVVLAQPHCGRRDVVEHVSGLLVELDHTGGCRCRGEDVEVAAAGREVVQSGGQLGELRPFAEDAARVSRLLP